MGDKKEMITLDLPQVESDDGWLNTYWRYYATMAAVMADNRGSNDYRVELLTNLIIATIPDPEIRETIKVRKHTLLDKIDESNIEKRNRLTMEICMDIIGDVTTEIDKSIGISQKIGVCIE